MSLLRKEDKGGGMMERLTEKQSSGFDLKSMNGEWCNKYCEQQRVQTCNECGIYQAIQKLAEYEDADEQGLLLRLPCPIGTTVYNTTLWDDVTEKVEVNGETLYRIVHRHKVSKSTFSLGDIYNFGKTVFLTQAEAEQKLKEMESDCNETN